MNKLSEREHDRQTAVHMRQHALRSWADANVLAEIGSKCNALLLRLLAVETLLKIVHAADVGATPSELQHASIDRLFWCASASHQRAMMESLGFEPEGSNLESADAILRSFGEHFVCARYQSYVGDQDEVLDSEGLPLDSPWPEMMDAAKSEWSHTDDQRLDLLFGTLSKLTRGMLDDKVYWDY
ncbi:MAG: hypothetical protein KGI64_06670 [Xanthomonadaceae bacterium]|nr:hypothetical protein [Xanthomonadaceae bacterium]